MTGCGQRGKPTAGFPRCPQPLEIAGAIPTFPPPRRGRGKVESPEAGLPTFPQHDLVVDTEFIKEARRRRYPPPSRLIVRLENAGAGRFLSHSRGLPRLTGGRMSSLVGRWRRAAD